MQASLAPWRAVTIGLAAAEGCGEDLSCLSVCLCLSAAAYSNSLSRSLKQGGCAVTTTQQRQREEKLPGPAAQEGKGLLATGSSTGSPSSLEL